MARGTLRQDSRYAQSPQKQWPATAAPCPKKRYGRNAGQVRLSHGLRDCWNALRLSPSSLRQYLDEIFRSPREVGSIVGQVVCGWLAKNSELCLCHTSRIALTGRY